MSDAVENARKVLAEFDIASSRSGAEVAIALRDLLAEHELLLSRVNRPAHASWDDASREQLLDALRFQGAITAEMSGDLARALKAERERGALLAEVGRLTAPRTKGEVEAAGKAAWARSWPLSERAEDIWRGMSNAARKRAIDAARVALDTADKVRATKQEGDDE